MLNHNYRFIALFVALFGIRTAAPISAATANAPNVSDREHRNDIEGFEDAMEHYGDRPSNAALQRTAARAASDPRDAESAYWTWHFEHAGWIDPGKESPAVLLRRAASLGFVRAQAQVAVYMCQGTNGFGKQPEEGMKTLQKLAASGDGVVEYALAVAYANGWGIPHARTDKAEALLRLAADHGYLPALKSLAQLYAAEGEKKKSEEYYQRAALAGDVESIQVMLDSAHFAVAVNDPRLANGYMTRGVLFGDPETALMLAANVLLERGEEKLDLPLVSHLLIFSARGDQRGWSLLARARIEGIFGVPRQIERGRRELEWLAGGADRSGTAAYLLGRALREGKCVPADSEHGLGLIQKAAHLGYPPAVQWLANRKAAAASDPTTIPAARLSAIEKARVDAQSLSDVLLDAATRVDWSEPEKATSPKMSAHDQLEEDFDELRDWWASLSTSLPDGVVERVADQATSTHASEEAKAWTAILALSGLTSRIDPPTARAWLRDAARQQLPQAMSSYGQSLMNGDGRRESVGDATRLLPLASDKGDPCAPVILGSAYISGAPPFPKDISKGLSILRKAAEDGNRRALWPLAITYYNNQSWDDLLWVMTRGYAVDDMRTDAMLAWVAMGYFSFGTEKLQIEDPWNRILLRGALLGNPVIGTLVGIEVAKRGPGDPALSRLLLRRAAASGCIQGKAMLASALISGAYDIKPDPERGLAELEELASEKDGSSDAFDKLQAAVGVAEAKWQLGQLLSEGRFVKQDRKRGRELIEAAAAEHNPMAAKWLTENAIR